MTELTQKDWEAEKKRLVSSMNEWYDRLIAHLELVAKDVRAHKERFNDVLNRDRKSFYGPISALSDTVHDMSNNVLGNMRLDLAINRAADLERVLTELEKFEKEKVK